MRTLWLIKYLKHTVTPFGTNSGESAHTTGNESYKMSIPVHSLAGHRGQSILPVLASVHQGKNNTDHMKSQWRDSTNSCKILEESKAEQSQNWGEGLHNWRNRGPQTTQLVSDRAEVTVQHPDFRILLFLELRPLSHHLDSSIFPGGVLTGKVHRYIMLYLFCPCPKLLLSNQSSTYLGHLP